MNSVVDYKALKVIVIKNRIKHCLNAGILSLLMCVFSAVQAQTAALAPIGMSEYKRLNRSEFIAELSVPRALSDQGEALANRLMHTNTPAQMKMIVTAQRLSARNFLNRWIEGMAVNNKAAVLADEKASIQAFAAAFKGRLLKGDRVIIARYNNDLRVSVNGIPILNIPTQKGFSLLLSTWIGDVPLSSSFREGVLGGTPFDELSSRARNLPVLPHRKANVRQWLVDGEPSLDNSKTSEEQAAVADSEENRPSGTGSEALSPINSPTPITQEPNSDTSTAIQDTVRSPVSAKPKKIEPEAAPNNKAPDDPRVVQSNDTTEKRIPSNQAAKSSVKVTTNNASKTTTKSRIPVGSLKPQEGATRSIAKPESLEPPPSTTFSSDNLLEYQQYYARMSELVNVHRNLPRSALARRISGEVRVAVRLDRSGKVLSQSLVSPSRYKMLNKQAMEAIALASPFDPVPSSITGENLVFDLLVVYPKYW